MKKIITVLLVALSLICIVGCNAVSDETTTYEITSEIHSLDVEISSADFKIENADEFSVVSNLKYLSVTEVNGVLSIVDNSRGNKSYKNAMLTIYIPSNIVFNEVDLEIGAASLTIDSLSTSTAELSLGAGDVEIESINASSSVEIEGGTGEITIANGTLNNLSLELGTGEMNLTGAILGNSSLEFGVGESNVTLIGNREDYRLDVEKSVGSITIDGESINGSYVSGNGQNRIEIEGGVGSINVTFQEN